MKRYIVRGETTKEILGEADTLKEAYEIEIEIEKRLQRLGHKPIKITEIYDSKFNIIVGGK